MTALPDIAKDRLLPWRRQSGPLADLPWLKDGRLTETIPLWFVDFFVKTRNIGFVAPESADDCTMTTLEDNWCLYQLVKTARPTRSLEIGIMRGSSSVTIGKAIADLELICTQTAIDVDPKAVEVVSRRFATFDLNPNLNAVIADSRDWLPRQSDNWQFAFLDGDHVFDTVAFEVTEVYNRTELGGWIVLHDTGSVRWGTRKDPGVLFFEAVDRELGDSAELAWLDSTSCDQDMRLRTALDLHVTLPPISEGIAVGYGGLGMIRKLDARRFLSFEQLLKYKPRQPPEYYPPRPARAKRILNRHLAVLGS